MRDSQIRFIRLQGYATSEADDRLYSALMLQPKLIGILVVFGSLVQSSWFFLALAVLLWWNAIVPTHNLFDAIYNYTVAYPRRLPPLGAAPAPRRFAQALAGMNAFVIAAALLAGANATAWVAEGMFIVAVLAVVFGDICSGANAYHLLRRLFDRSRPLQPNSQAGR